MKFVNLTPHDVVILRDEGDLVFRPSGIVARAEVTRITVANLDGIPVVYTRYDGVTNLPEPQPNTVYIVSTITAMAAVDRHDLVMVEDLVRTTSGYVLGAQCLAVLSPELLPGGAEA